VLYVVCMMGDDILITNTIKYYVMIDVRYVYFNDNNKVMIIL